MIHRFCVYLTVVLTFMVAGCGRPDRNELVDTQNDPVRSLTNGKPIATEKFGPVVQIANVQGNRRSLCTATFVSPRTLITAAHCVDEGNTVRIEKALPTSVGKVASAVYSHPNYGGRTAGGDLAIVVFSEDLASRFYRVKTSPDGITAGTVIAMVGFGMTDDRNYQSGGNKTWGTNVITPLRSIAATLSVAGLQFGPGTGNEASLSNGDSGGPLFFLGGASASEDNATNQVIGIASTKEIGLVQGKHIGNYTNLSHSLHRDWLVSLTAKGVVIAGINGDPADPNPISPPPAPPVNPSPNPPGPVTPPLAVTALYYGWNRSNQDHQTFVGVEYGRRLVSMGYDILGKIGCVFTAPGPNLIPLKNFSLASENLATATREPGALYLGYRATRTLGYVSRVPGAGLVPLKLYKRNRDFFTLAGRDAEVRAQTAGYDFMGTEGYVATACE